MQSIKKISLIVGVLAFANLASAAMSDYNIYVGAGVNMFKPKNKFDDGKEDVKASQERITYNNKVGFNAGALGYIKMADMISLRTGVFYSMKNFQMNDGGTPAGDNNDPPAGNSKANEVTLSYVDVPVTLAYSMNKMAHIYGGANVSFKVNYSEETEFTSDIVKDDNLKSFLITGTIGGQFNVMDRVGVDVYAEMGFGSLLDVPEATDSTTEDPDNNDVAKSPLGFGARLLYRF